MNRPRYIYHITTAAEWLNAGPSGTYIPDSLEKEGFIHCSTGDQVAGVLERYFKGKKELLRLLIDTTRLVNELRWERSPSMGQEFPHIYGSLNISAVIDIHQI